MSDAIRRINARASAAEAVEKTIKRELARLDDDVERNIVIGSIERSIARIKEKI